MEIQFVFGFEVMIYVLTFEISGNLEQSFIVRMVLKEIDILA